jgi:hypothetical protein
MHFYTDSLQIFSATLYSLSTYTLLMVVCTPTKKARIWHMKKADGKTFSEIGKTVCYHPTHTATGMS